MNNLLNKSLAEIAETLPHATGVFHRYDLHYCKAGGVTLKTAIEDSALSSQEVLQALEQVSPPGKEDNRLWDLASDAELVAHIIERYHQAHRKQLPELIRLASKVERVHGSHTACPIGITQQLKNMEESLESHMQREEQILFPLLSEGLRDSAHGPISVMMFEHDEHLYTLRNLAQTTHHFWPPHDACPSWRALYRGLGLLAKDIREHVRLENEVLFTRN